MGKASRNRLRHDPFRGNEHPVPHPEAPASPPVAGPGTLYVVATPIGNLDDVTPRALRVLRQAEVIACEDTRVTGMLLKHLGIERGDRRLVPYHDVNERRACHQLVEILRAGQDVALVSDAGTPLLSDPGYRVVSMCRDLHLPVVPVPGPCAAVAALCAAGLPSDRFTFYGFLPAKSGRRLRLVETLREDGGTCIFYVPARQVDAVLADFQAARPQWRIVVARELTKVFEEFLSGTAAEVRASVAGRVLKGEVTLLAAPPADGKPTDPDVDE